MLPKNPTTITHRGIVIENKSYSSEDSSDPESNVTHLETPLLELVDDLRRILISNRVFRIAFLSLLEQIYYLVVQRRRHEVRLAESGYGSGTCGSYSELKRPTGDSVLEFFNCHWPEIRLVDPGDEGDYVQVSRRQIPMSYPLVRCWLKKVSLCGLYFLELLFTVLQIKDENPTDGNGSAEKLALLLKSVILHELGHIIVSWWSEDTCVTPGAPPFFGEPGDYIEGLFFGGMLEGWWVPGTVGRFEELREVGIMHLGPLILGEYCMARIYHRD
jgi:hypothetical protein